MPNEKLEADVFNFILDYVDSVAELEILALFYKGKSQHWTASEIARELRSSEAAANINLRALLKKELLTELGGAYKLDSIDSTLDGLTQRVLIAYRERKVSVIALIYDKPAMRLRRFADAFKFKKED